LKAFFTDIYRKNRWLMLEALGLFLCGYFLNLYFSSNTSVRNLRNSIQTFLQDREQDFEGLTKDTATLEKLVDRQYTEQELSRLIDRKYALFLYDTDTAGAPGTLQFWNDQRSLPSPDLLSMADGYSFVQLSNGQYNAIKKTVKLHDDRVVAAIALIPIRWQ
jgi:hypothetical protein